MTRARDQAWIGLAIAGVALVVGLVVSRGDDDPADELKSYNAGEARRRAAARELTPADRMEGLSNDRPFDSTDVPHRDLVPTPASDLEVEVTTLLLRIDGHELSNDELTARAQTVAAANPDAAVTLRAHPDVPYERVVEILDLLRKAGLTQIAFTAAPSP